MSAKQSFLSSFNCDVVVAATEASINATMKSFLDELSDPSIKIIFVWSGPRGQKVQTQITYDELMERTDNTDPFSIPNDADPETDPRLQKLMDADYAVGINAAIGLPHFLDPLAIENVVKFGDNPTVVEFGVICREFQVTQIIYGSRQEKDSWRSINQPPERPWIYKTTVDLRKLDPGKENYKHLPPDVQERIKELEKNKRPFSVEQLYLDLSNARVQSVPSFPNLEKTDPAFFILSIYFCGLYFEKMQKEGKPILGCTISQPGVQDNSTLTLTSMTMAVNPFVGSNGTPVNQPTEDQRRRSTLNYLCAIDNKNTPERRVFPWNWVEDLSVSSGILSINRDVFAHYIRRQLEGYVARNCFRPWVSVSQPFKPKYEWSMTAPNAPTINYPKSGSKVIEFSWQQKARDNNNGGFFEPESGIMELSPFNFVDVYFESNTITIVQTFKLYCYIEQWKSNSGGNAIDIVQTDVYTIVVDGAGRLGTKITSKTVNTGKMKGGSDFLAFFTNIKQLERDVLKWAERLKATAINVTPVNFVQDFVFPAGNTFAFKNVRFSDHQDLTAEITYRATFNTLVEPRRVEDISEVEAEAADTAGAH